MNAPALININIPSLQMAEDELIRVLEASVYPGAQLQSIKLVVGYCKGQNLDPMLKPIHIVPMSVKKAGTKDQYDWRDVLMPGIGLYRTIAARTGEYAGCTEPEFGPMTELAVGEFRMKHPEWCRVTVHRIVQGQVVAFTAKEYWVENYATMGKESEVPNKMWKKRPMGQLAKCAEAQALRKGFPEVGALPTAEEMEGKTLYPTDALAIEGEFKTIEQPKPKGDSPDSRPAGDSAGGPTGGGVSTGTTDEPKYKGAPATDGMKRTVRAALSNAALSEVDMKARFGFSLDEMPRDAVNAVMEFIKNPAGEK